MHGYEDLYGLNGLPLDDDHCRVIVGTTWVAGISPRRSVTTVKGRHGTVVHGFDAADGRA